MDAIFQRLFDVAGCRSQLELAAFLGIRQSAISDAKRRGIIPADWPVRVKVIPQELATAASMTENGQRRDMHPAEQIAGFRAMA